MSTISFKPVVLAHQLRSDGTYNVKIRISFKRKSMYYPTTIYVRKNDVTKGGKVKDMTAMARADELCLDLRRVAASLNPFSLERMTPEQLVSYLKGKLSNEEFHLDFFAFCDGYLAGRGKSTRIAYETALNSFARFLGCRSIDINAITRQLMQDYYDRVSAEPRLYSRHGTLMVGSSGDMKKGSSASATTYVRRLAFLYNQAKDRYNDDEGEVLAIPRDPFRKLSMDIPSHEGQKSIGKEGIQAIIDYQPQSDAQTLARASFLLSFCLMGANFADMYEASPVEDEVFVYNRMKTRTRRADKAEMRVVVPDCALPFIEALEGNRDGWWLSLLHRDAPMQTVRFSANRALKTIAKELGMEEFTFYAARHTWATLARNEARLEKSLVDECLGHVGDYRVADIYIERDWNIMAEANAKVLSLFDWR